MRLTHKIMEYTDLEDLEERFYEEDGVYEQIGRRVEEYIFEHRDVFQVLSGRIQTYSHYKNYHNYVIFSACEDYADNLDQVAVEGRIQFQTKHSNFFGGKPASERENYTSEILENPTWLEVALCANDMINVTGDTHHVYLEGIHKTGQFTLDDESFIIIYNFSMGS